jgi:hypothetical protein
MRPVGCAVLACLLFLSAETLSAQPAGQVQVVQAEGFGTIFGGDTAQARDLALIDARRKALEQVAGVQVEADTILRNMALFDQMLKIEARGIIQADRVLEEGPTGDGRYRVRIEAWVKVGEVQDRIASLLSELSIVVMVPEQNIGKPQSQPIVENEIVSQLSNSGYRVLDHAQVLRVAARDQAAALLRGDAQAVREIGLRFLSNLIVVGEATTRPREFMGIISAHARVTARVIEAETGRIIPQGNFSESQERGFGQDQVSAGEQALGKAAKKAADHLGKAVDEYVKKKERRIEVRLKGLPSLDEYRRAKALLQKQRWVNNVEEGGYSSDESVIFLMYPEKTLYLASGIGRDQRYRVLQADRSRILVEYRP